MEQVLVGFLLTLLIAGALIFIKNERLSAKRIKNTQAHRFSAREYIMVTFRFVGEEVVLCLTQTEFNKARQRAESNPEDVWKNQ
mgnify:FL=1